MLRTGDCDESWPLGRSLRITKKQGVACSHGPRWRRTVPIVLRNRRAFGARAILRRRGTTIHLGAAPPLMDRLSGPRCAPYRATLRHPAHGREGDVRFPTIHAVLARAGGRGVEAGATGRTSASSGARRHEGSGGGSGGRVDRTRHACIRIAHHCSSQRPCPRRLTRAAAAHQIYTPTAMAATSVPTSTNTRCGRVRVGHAGQSNGGRSVHVAAGRIRRRLALAGGTSAADRAAGRGRPHP